jgi:hypothetical protein
MLHRILALLVVAAAVAPAAQTPGSSPQRPARDTPAQLQDAPAVPEGRISGRVVAADTGRPLKRARVFATAAELPQGRGVLTDDNGAFELTDLPAGRYSVTANRAGFVGLTYGQRRPLQAGTPLQLGDGQQLKGVDFSLPRGSVIAGRVSDQDGDPMPGVNVQVLRYQYLQGDRRATQAGNAQTDDRGQYRVWGLMPGEYYVSALARNANPGGRGFGPNGGRRPPGAPSGDTGDAASLAYAPTYFPGVPSINEAKPIALGLSQELLGVDFHLQLVRTARISGRVTNPDGTPTTRGNISLAPEAATRGQIGMNYGARIQWDGAFSMVNVPPGRYVLRARGEDAATAQYAAEPLTVGEADITGLTVILTPGGSISGAVAFPPAATDLPDFEQIRIAAPSLEPDMPGGQGQTRVAKDGTFRLDGVAAGQHLIRAQNGLRGWSLKSVVIDGRDVTDLPVEVRSGQHLADVTVTFTDLQTQITGMVADTRGTPITEYTVLAFPTNVTYWRPLSRHIMTARPDQTGRFTIRGLPAGEYYLATVDPSEQGEWFDPAYLEEQRFGAPRLTLGEGETKTQNFEIKN